MKYRFLSTIFAVSVGVWLLPHSMVDAVTFRDGTVSFVQPPRLVSATTPYKSTHEWDTTYYFTLEVPANSGEPLQRVSFNQIQGVEVIEFNQKTTFAFEGTRKRKGVNLGINAEKSDRQKQTFTVTFDPPVSPGQTVTIGLKTFRNPRVGGVYLIGVTAFPSGNQAAGQFLGIGRLQFYAPSRFGPFF
ncbi:MAG: DUF2808 domain-containing protein [Goleter apudmare HA4340-LM2]|nr:DUF2808 domain-containing protein [Goleter apudmare HA4340-LM2]